MNPSRPHPSDLPAASTLASGQATDVSVPPPQTEGYEIVSELAAAGQGRVWKARQLSTHREVALKVPRVDLLRSRASSAARLNHPSAPDLRQQLQELYYYVG
jgi:serine/threonine protein kinase